MSCDRYWREGVVLVERGLDDPHREHCEDCARAHASRQELIEALPLIGAGHTGDPRWQDKVWRRIEGDRAPAHRRWQWSLAGVLALAGVVVLWIALDRMRSGPESPPREVIAAAEVEVEIVKRGVPTRSQADPHVGDEANVDDLLRVTVRGTADVWVYRDDRLVLSCSARDAGEGCRPDAGGMEVELILSAPGTYRAIVVDAPGALRPRGVRDSDLGALKSAGVSYTEHRVKVR